MNFTVKCYSTVSFYLGDIFNEIYLNSFILTMQSGGKSYWNIQQIDSVHVIIKLKPYLGQVMYVIVF